MKSFDEIYNELQNENNTELEEAWQEAKKENRRKKKISIIICLIIDIIYAIMFFKNKTIYRINSTIFFTTIFILIINIFVVVVISIIFNKKKKMYNNKFKEIVINKLIGDFYDNLEYFPKKLMPERIYRSLKYEGYDIYHSDDYFEALINNKYSIQMAEILTKEEETYTDSDGDKHTRYITKFHGLFAKIVMNKSIDSELRIMQDKAFIVGNKLKMDSDEFEKYFDVTATNKIIGMQLLTADIMEELIEFENKTKIKFDVIIKNNELYLRFHSGEMFEAGNIKKGLIDKEKVQSYFNILKFTYNLANKLINLVNETQI